MRFITRKRTSKISTALLLCLASLFFISQFFLPNASSAADPAAVDTQLIAEMNKPGVVMIETLYKATVGVPEVQISQEGMYTIQMTVAQQVINGVVANNEQAITKAVIAEFLKNPLSYIEPTGGMITKDVQIGTMGTGFIVTPDGYIVTNAHVVYTPEEELKMNIAQTALQDMVQQDVKEFVSALQNVYTPTKEELNALAQADIDFYVRYMQVSNVQTSSACGIGLAIPGVTTVQKGFACDVRKRGEPAPGKDVAILKIDKKDLPTVTLGDDSSMNTGNNVYALGYPGAATFNPMLAADASNSVESTFTKGVVSARKTMPGGWSIMQIDAPTTHGNSGGPVFNDKGEVVGIVTFGSIDFGTGQEVQGMNFAVPISIANQFLNELNVKPTQSELTKNYTEALKLFNQEKYKKALEKFKEINDINPGYPYVQGYISKCTTNIAAGKDKSFDFMFFALIGLGVLAVIAIVVVVVVVVRKKSGPKNQYPQQQYQMPYGQPPGAPPQYNPNQGPPPYNPNQGPPPYNPNQGSPPYNPNQGPPPNNPNQGPRQ
ncbi:MAG: trypsin-like serine protease [Firmicutes bacterium]|nr:trypsin-like serine protease [Bacillota bacterium]